MISEKNTRIFINTALVLGLVSIVLFISGTFLSMFLDPNHDFIRDVISVTGESSNQYSWLFNSTLIISGIIMTPSFPAIYLLLKEYENPKPKLLQALTVFGTLIGPFMSFAGVFNEEDNFIFHIIFAVGAYAFVIFAAFLWGIYVWKMDEIHPYKSNKLWWLDISVNFIIIACLIAYVLAMSFFQWFIWDTLGILEKVTIYAFFVFFITIIARLLYIVNKKKVEK